MGPELSLELSWADLSWAELSWDKPSQYYTIKGAAKGELTLWPAHDGKLNRKTRPRYLKKVLKILYNQCLICLHCVNKLNKINSWSTIFQIVCSLMMCCITKSRCYRYFVTRWKQVHLVRWVVVIIFYVNHSGWLKLGRWRDVRMDQGMLFWGTFCTLRTQTCPAILIMVLNGDHFHTWCVS